MGRLGNSRLVARSRLSFSHAFTSPKPTISYFRMRRGKWSWSSELPNQCEPTEVETSYTKPKAVGMSLLQITPCARRHVHRGTFIRGVLQPSPSSASLTVLCSRRPLRRTPRLDLRLSVPPRNDQKFRSRTKRRREMGWHHIRRLLLGSELYCSSVG